MTGAKTVASGTGVETAGGTGASGDVPEPPDYLACAGVEAGGAGVAASQLGAYLAWRALALRWLGMRLRISR